MYLVFREVNSNDIKFLRVVKEFVVYYICELWYDEVEERGGGFW